MPFGLRILPHNTNQQVIFYREQQLEIICFEIANTKITHFYRKQQLEIMSFEIANTTIFHFCSY